jgi:hypothetical protein
VTLQSVTGRQSRLSVVLTIPETDGGQETVGLASPGQGAGTGSLQCKVSRSQAGQ